MSWLMTVRSCQACQNLHRIIVVICARARITECLHWAWHFVQNLLTLEHWAPWPFPTCIALDRSIRRPCCLTWYKYASAHTIHLPPVFCQREDSILYLLGGGEVLDMLQILQNWQVLMINRHNRIGIIPLEASFTWGRCWLCYSWEAEVSPIAAVRVQAQGPFVDIRSLYDLWDVLLICYLTEVSVGFPQFKYWSLTMIYSWSSSSADFLQRILITFDIHAGGFGLMLLVFTFQLVFR